MTRKETTERADKKKQEKINEFLKEAAICGMLYTQVLDQLDKERDNLLEAYGFKSDKKKTIQRNE